MIPIRPATPPCLPALLAVSRRSVEATHAFLASADVDAIAEDVEHYLPFMSDLRVAERDSQVLGFVEVGRSEVDGEGRPFPLRHLEFGIR